MKLNSKKTKPMVVSLFRDSDPSYDYLALDGAELKEVTSLLILGVTLD